MPPLFSMIREVSPKKMHWALKLRLVRRYQQPAFGNNEILSTECIFHDLEGSRIHATIKKPMMENFTKTLKEGHLYAVKDVIVAENSMKYKTTSCKYKINFVMKTQVCQISDEMFPTYMHEFKPFTELKNEDVDESILFDVIGNLVARDAPQNKEFGGRFTKLINVILEDIENNRLSCTLWGDFVDDIMTHLEKSLEQPVIVILKFCRAKRFKGEIRVSNTYHVTQMLINAKSDVVADFRDRLRSECNTPNTVSTISLPSTQSILEDISTSKATFRTIEQISENHEVGSFWILAKIAVVETNGEWYYLSCVKCPKKLTPVGDTFYCERCDHFDANGNLRFKIQVRVVDNTGNALFLLWDRECVELIGKTATDLRTQVLNQDSNLGVRPKEIDDLVDRKVLFKVQVRPGQTQGFNSSYTVMKLTFDTNVIKKIFGEILESQESDVFSKLKSTEHGDMTEICSSEDEVATPLKPTTKVILSNDVMKDSTLKRSLIDEFSSTIPDKKMKAAIKQEKD